jgi:polygalacturonase
MSKAKFILPAFLFLLTLHLSAKEYKISDFGAKADGITLNTCTIQKAINYISENGGGRLVFEAGNYVTGSIYVKSNVTIQLDYGATLLGSTNPFDYVKDKKI